MPLTNSVDDVPCVLTRSLRAFEPVKQDDIIFAEHFIIGRLLGLGQHRIHGFRERDEQQIEFQETTAASHARAAVRLGAQAHRPPSRSNTSKADHHS